MRILVVDDDLLGLDILLTFLKEYGNCDSACDGGEALEKFYTARNSGAPYDLICLDVLMPGLDGDKVLAEIRKTEADGGHVSCVFIITGHESPELFDNIEGADDFISKPCSANLIKRVLGRHHLLEDSVPKQQYVLVISGDYRTRASISGALNGQNILPLECTTFIEAENHARTHPCSAVVADILTVVRPKDAEQLAVVSLQNIFPFIRVKVKDDVVSPIIMTQEDRGQDIMTYLKMTCSTFTPRLLRTYKRHKTFFPIHIMKSDGLEYLTFTHDISWGGAFVVMNSSCGLVAGNTLSVDMPTLNISIDADVVRVQAWGKQEVVPGVGLRWKSLDDPTIIAGLNEVLKTKITNDGDRLLR